MSTFTILGVIIGISTFIPLCIGLHIKAVKQNPTTWILWATLDTISAVSIMYRDGSWLLPFAYSCGSIITCVFILKSKNPFSWTWFETTVTTFVLVCLIVWGTSGARVATIASSLALCGAGIPQLVDFIKRPWENSILVYFFCTVANVLVILGGKDWSVEERFYPTTAAIYTTLVVIATSQKFFRKPMLQQYLSMKMGVKI